MIRIHLALSRIALCWALFSVYAFAQNPVGEDRLAIVIGNRDYEGNEIFPSARNAEVMAEALESLRFEVRRYENIDSESFFDVLDFLRLVDYDYDIILFYYSGYIAQINGDNYLVPVERSFHLETLYDDPESIETLVPLEDVIRRLRSAQTAGIGVFQISQKINFYPRNNSSTRLGVGYRELQDSRYSNVILIFSSRPDVTVDRVSVNVENGHVGLFTEYLANALKRENRTVDRIFEDAENHFWAHGNSEIPHVYEDEYFPSINLFVGANPPLPGGITILPEVVCRAQEIQISDNEWKLIQTALRDYGFYNATTIDGACGPNTLSAIRVFQAVAFNEDMSGILSSEQFNALIEYACRDGRYLGELAEACPVN